MPQPSSGSRSVRFGSLPIRSAPAARVSASGAISDGPATAGPSSSALTVTAPAGEISTDQTLAGSAPVGLHSAFRFPWPVGSSALPQYPATPAQRQGVCSTPLTKVLLGPYRHEVIVRSQVVMQSSGHFREVCTRDINDQNRRRPASEMVMVVLDDVDPELFKLYLDWLDPGTAHSAGTVLNYDFLDDPAMGLPGIDWSADFGATIIGLYKMGERLQDEAFCRALMVKDVSAYIDGTIAGVASTFARLDRYAVIHLRSRPGVFESLRTCVELLNEVRSKLEPAPDV